MSDELIEMISDALAEKCLAALNRVVEPEIESIEVSEAEGLNIKKK